MRCVVNHSRRCLLIQHTWLYVDRIFIMGLVTRRKRESIKVRRIYHFTFILLSPDWNGTLKISKNRQSRPFVRFVMNIILTANSERMSNEHVYLFQALARELSSGRRFLCCLL